jgi:PEP-CTERM motif
MKKAIVLAIIGCASAVATSSYGQSVVFMNNYTSSGPYVTYGAGSDGTAGTKIGSAYTMGMYYALGNITGSIASDPTGIADPTTLGALLLATGAGSTAQFSASVFGTPGAAAAGAAWAVPGTSGNGGETITLIIVAYEGASYGAASHRGHSNAFIMATSANTSPSPNLTGSAMPAFSTFTVPEPTTMALGGLGLASLLLFRRKHA